MRFLQFFIFFELAFEQGRWVSAARRIETAALMDAWEVLNSHKFDYSTTYRTPARKCSMPSAFAITVTPDSVTVNPRARS